MFHTPGGRLTALVRRPVGSGSIGFRGRTDRPARANQRRARLRSAGHRAQPRPRPPLRRGARRARVAVGRVGAGGALRPGRRDRVRPRLPGPARRVARRGRRPGGVSRPLAERRLVHPGAGEGLDLDPHPRPPPRGRSRAARAAAPHRVARGSAGAVGGLGGGGGVAAARAGAGADGARRASRPAARGDRARLLRRPHAVGARGAARPAAGHDQEQNVRGPLALARAARRPGGGGFMDVHELTAGYALDALDPAERATFEEHLASCERCRAELQGFWQVSGALAHAAGGPMPPASLRARILEQARSERSNVVPLRRSRFLVPALSSAAAVAAVAAIALGLWATSLSRDLDGAERELAVLGDPSARTYESADGEADLVVAPSGD